MKTFDTDTYLQRVNHTTDVIISEDGLRALHRAQLYTIPFENLDVLLGRGISLEPETLFNKLVHRPRGGYCFELNGLFLAALQTFGFNARALLARVHLSGTPSGRGHQVSLVTINGKQWLADVGFGGLNMLAPFPLKLNHPRTFKGQTLRLAEAGSLGTMLQVFKEDSWQDLYSFELGYVYPIDIAYGNHYTSTHPDAFFTSNCMVALPTTDGRVTLFNDTLTIVSDNEERVCDLGEGQDYIDGLKTYFGIELDATYESLLPLPDPKAERQDGPLVS